MSTNVNNSIASENALDGQRRLLKMAGILTGLACAGHLLIGADPLVVGIAALTVLLSLLPVWNFGFMNIGALLMALVGLRYIGFAIFAKLAMRQPLSSNLYDPEGSFLVVLVGVTGYLAAFLIAMNLKIGKPLLPKVEGERQLGRIWFMAWAIGVAAVAGFSRRAGEQYNGIHLANMFMNFLDLGLICAFARNILRSGRQLADWRLWLTAACILELVIVVNSRGVFADGFLCFVVTKAAFDTKIRWKTLISVCVLIALFLLAITPILLYVRQFRSHLTWRQIISVTYHTAENWQEIFREYGSQETLLHGNGFYFSKYYGKSENVFERATLIAWVDLLKSGSDKVARHGDYDLRTAFEEVMPRFLAPNKPGGFSQGDWLYRSIGVPTVMGGYSTAPLSGEGYAGFGWTGAFLYPFLMGLGVLLLVKKICGFDLGRNVWAIFILLSIHNSFVEGDSGSYMAMFFRGLPQDLVLMWVMVRLSMVGLIRPSWRAQIDPPTILPPVPHP